MTSYEQAKRIAEIKAHSVFISALLGMHDAYYAIWSAAYDSAAGRPHVDKDEWSRWIDTSNDWHKRAEAYVANLAPDVLEDMPCTGGNCDDDATIDAECFVHEIARTQSRAAHV
jgi:hypothetical protein